MQKGKKKTEAAENETPYNQLLRKRVHAGEKGGKHTETSVRGIWAEVNKKLR